MGKVGRIPKDVINNIFRNVNITELKSGNKVIDGFNVNVHVRSDTLVELHFVDYGISTYVQAEECPTGPIWTNWDYI